MNRTRMHTQHGQGLVGFVVAAVFVLVPSMLAVNYLARVGDARHRTEEAARYALWERTVWQTSSGGAHVKTDGRLARESLVRLYGQQGALLDSKKDGDLNEGAPRLDANLYLWQGKANQRKPLLARAEAEGFSLVENTSNAQPEGGAFSAANSTVAAVLGLNESGFVRAQVDSQLNVADILSGHINSDALAMSRQNAMFLEAWNGGDATRIRKAVERTVPTQLLDNGLFNTLADAAAVVGFDEFDHLKFGYVDPEVVPCQRLIRSNGQSAC